MKNQRERGNSNMKNQENQVNWVEAEKADDLLKNPTELAVIWRGFLDTGRYSEGDWLVLNAVGEDEYEWQETDGVTHFAIAENPEVCHEII